MSKKNIIIIVVSAVILLAAGAILFFQFYPENKFEQRKIIKMLSGKPELLAKYDEIKAFEKRLKAEKQNEVNLLFNLGFYWKGLGELTKENFFFEKSLAIYEKGMKVTADKNVLFYWNAGKVAERLGNFSLAEEYYKKSITISPSYEDGYINLADLYRLKLNKKPEEILAVYQAGLEATMANANLFLGKCSYLRQLNKNSEALACYELLSQSYPDNQGYKDMVAELKAKQ